MKLLTTFCLTFLFLSTSKAELISCQINGIKSTTGNVLIGVFNSENGFDNLNTIKDFTISKKTMVNGVLKFTVDLPPGEYGFSILDDSNKDGEMEYNFLGVPKEGFGFSNYVHSGIFKPKFEAFKFLLKKGKTALVKIKVKYM